MCARPKMTRKLGIMNMRLFRKIIDEIAQINPSVRVWMVFIGEALIIKYRLFWMIHYAKRKGLTDVVLNSNGTLLDEEAALGLIESGLDAIYVGIDAFTPETYNKLRVGGNYERVVNNVNSLLELKRKLGANKPQVFVQFVETEENKGEKDDFTKYWTKVGAIVKIRPKVSWAGTVEAKNLTSRKRHPCYWCMRTFNICWDGRVALCSADYDAKFVAGNVNNDSIQSIWLGQLKKIREMHLKANYNQLPPFCRDCKDWQGAKADFCGKV